MALLNNSLFNAAYLGFLQGALAGAWQSSQTAADYEEACDAAVAFATQLDSIIAADATITTGGSNTMLVDTASNTIQADTQFKPGLMQALCAAVWNGRYTKDATQADYENVALTVKAMYTQALTHLVTP